MNRYKVTLKLDDEKTSVMVYAQNDGVAKNIVTTMLRCSLDRILEVIEVDDTIHCAIRELEYKQFKDRVANMSPKEFNEFIMTMFTTYNFLTTVEDMDIDQVNSLQYSTPESCHVSMTSKKLADFFKEKLSMDIE
jgi:hypothetical protein